MDTRSASGRHTENPLSLDRRGENTIYRVLLQITPPLAHIVLSLALAMSLVFYLNDSNFDSGKRASWSDIFADTSLRVSDVTTLVSAALVLIRVVGQVFIASTVWRCAMILLQHDGLSLGQLDTMLSYKIPTSFSGQYSLLIAASLLMMLPSAYIAPIVSGSVNWQASVRGRSLQAGFGASPGLERPDYWQMFPTDANIRWEVTRYGLEYAATLWADTQRVGMETNVSDHQFRYAAREEAVVSTIVEQVPMPYIKVESMTWDKRLSQEVEDILKNKSKVNEYFYARSGDELRRRIGDSILFQLKRLPLPSKALAEGELYTDREWKIAVVVGDESVYLTHTGKKDFNCADHGWNYWTSDSSDNSDITLLYPEKSSICWAVGTIRLTAGVRTARQGRYITNWTVQAIEFADDARPRPDPWAEYAVFMLNDLNSWLSRVQSTGVGGGSVARFTEEAIRHGYIAIRHAFPEVNESGQRLKAYSPSPLLQAKVAKWRVWLWLGLSMLLPASWLLVLGVEMAAGGNLRAPALSAELIPLLTDVREVLVEDENGLSNMSYLTNEDRKGFGKIKLGILSTGPDGPPVYGLKAQRGGVLAELAGQKSG